MAPEFTRGDFQEITAGGDGLTPDGAVRFRLEELMPEPRIRMLAIWLEGEWVTTYLGAIRNGNQRLLHHGNRVLDAIEVQLPTGQVREVYFDVTALFDGSLKKLDGLGKHAREETPICRFKWKRWGKVLLVLLVLGGVFAGFSRMSRISEAKPNAAMWVMLSIVTLAVWFSVFAPVRLVQRRAPWIMLLISLGATSGWVFLPVAEVTLVWRLVPVCRVHVENRSETAVFLELNRRHWLDMAPGQTELRTLRRRGALVTVKDAATGTTLEEHPISALDTGPYILNVLSAGTYYTGEVTYTPPWEEEVSPFESAVQEPWIYARVDFLFERPPNTIEVKTRKGELTYGRREIRALGRGEEIFKIVQDFDRLTKGRFAPGAIGRSYLLRESLLTADEQQDKDLERFLKTSETLMEFQSGDPGRTNEAVEEGQSR